MNEMSNEINPTVERLMLEKSYEKLSAQERQLVDQFVTKEEYVSFREVILQSKMMFAEKATTPSSKVHSALLNKLKEQKRTTTPGFRFWDIFNYRVPAWQMALGMGLVLLYFFSSGNMEDPVPADPQIVYVYKTDTVYKEKPALIKTAINPAPKQAPKKIVKKSVPSVKKEPTMVDTLYRVAQELKIIPKNRRIEVPSLPMASPTFALNIDTFATRKVLGEEPRKNLIGRSVSEEKALMDVLTEIY